MNEAKFRRAMEGQTGIARKIYEFVPAREAWETRQIMAEAIRNNSQVDYTVLKACLYALVRSGLVAEPKQHTYIRVPVRMKAVQDIVEGAAATIIDNGDEHLMQISSNTAVATKPATTEAPTTKPTTAVGRALVKAREAKPPTILERLAELASRAKHLESETRKLASDIETAALEISDSIAGMEQKAEKLEQLQALLKG